MVAGGAESCIHPLAIGGFARARSLATDYNDSPEQASRPFDADRKGFVVGEGASTVILEVRSLHPRKDSHLPRRNWNTRKSEEHGSTPS